MSHPSGAELELVALGEGSSESRAHVETCDECRAWVERYRADANAFAAKGDADAFVDAALRRAERESRGGEVRSFDRLLRTRAVWAALPIAAAAALLLLIRPIPEHGPVSDRTPTELGDRPRETTFKGGFIVAVVRERAGAQERLVADRIDVRPFDRLRLEIATDRPTPLAAGALGDDGTWVQLVAPATLDGGTYFSEFSLRFDQTPTSGVILAGEPAAVERARTTRDFNGVRVLRLRPAP